MGKIFLRWAAAGLVVLAVLVLAAVFGDGSFGLFWLILFLLSLVGGGSWATVGTVNVYNENKYGETVWLDAHGWDRETSLEYLGWKIFLNNQTREVAVFHAANSRKEPERVFRFDDVKGAELYQEEEKGKRSVRVVIQMINGRPYAMPVTNRPLPANSPELQQALAFAKKVNDLFAMIASGNAAGGASKAVFVIAKCYQCGQLLRGEAGRVGWCPKCDAHIQMPALHTPGVRIERS